MKERRKESENAWSFLDSQLNDHGEWLLVGAIACFSLPPTLCFVSAFTLLYVIALKQESYARGWKANLFKVAKSFTGQDFIEFKKLQNQLDNDRSKRNISIFLIGYIFIMGALFYGLIKMFLLNHGNIDSTWLEKTFWGSL